MKYHSVVLLAAVFLMIKWTGYISSSCTPTTASVSLTAKTEQAQKYEPASRGIPGRREGGGTR